MNDYDIAHSILSTILLRNIPFALALRNAYKKFDVAYENRNDITALVGCELRHHLLFKHLADKLFKDEKEECLIGFYLFLANSLFLKRFLNCDFEKLVKEELKALTTTYSEEGFDEFMKWVLKDNELIPSELEKDSPEYLSYRFNTPSWIIHMWQKQYGKKITQLILKANYKPALTTLRINPLFAFSEQVYANKSFKKSEVDEIVTYVGKAPLKKQEFFEKNGLFYQKMATKLLIDDLNLNPFDRIAIYSCYSHNVHLDLAVRFGQNVSIDMMINNGGSYLEVNKSLKINKLHNVRLNEINYSSIITCISSPVDCFFVMPKNSSFDLLRSTPDYFLRIEQSDLDKLIKEQKETLLEASKFIYENGRIIYMIPTISMKESSTLIHEFIEQNPSFKLEKERQFFPFESLDSCLYYAVIRKIK